MVLITIILFAPNGLIGLWTRQRAARDEVYNDGDCPARGEGTGDPLRRRGRRHGVDLDVFEGEKLAIIGPNGAGKTTFLDIATGGIRSRKGRHGAVFRAGNHRTPAARHHPLRNRPRFPDFRTVLDDTVIENLLIAAAGHSGRTSLMRPLHDLPERADMENLLDLVSIRDVADRKAGELPEGKRKLVDIAVALALKPRLLLMDEPTSGVASSEKFAIMDILVTALDKQRVTSVFVEHDMDMVTRYADRVAVWSAGEKSR